MKQTKLVDVAELELTDVSAGYFMTWCGRCKNEHYTEADSPGSAAKMFIDWGWRRVAELRLCPDCVLEVTGIEPNREEE